MIYNMKYIRLLFKRFAKVVSRPTAVLYKMQRIKSYVAFRGWNWDWSECEAEPHVCTRPIPTPRSSLLRNWQKPPLFVPSSSHLLKKTFHVESNVSHQLDIELPTELPTSNGLNVELTEINKELEHTSQIKKELTHQSSANKELQVTEVKKELTGRNLTSEMKPGR